MAGKLLEGRYFIVTGGTQGLGRGIALHLGEEGAAGLTNCGRDRDNGQAAMLEISQTGCSCEYVQADFFHEKDCRNVVQQALQRFGRVDGLVNAAGLTNRVLVGPNVRLKSREQVGLLLELRYSGDISFEPFSKEIQSLPVEELERMIKASVEYQYEAAEVMRCLRAGKLESDIMPLEESLRIMKTLDEIRKQWGLKYPME